MHMGLHHLHNHATMRIGTSFVQRQCALATARGRARLEEEALAALNGVLDPALARCKRLAVQPDASVAVKLEFRSGAMRRGAVEAAAAAAIEALPWARRSSVESTLSRPRSFMGSNAPPSLRHVGALVGISSCKGGVGKSTVAVNLAYALATQGGRVGLLDADVHGPSLPSLVRLPPGSLPLRQDAQTRLLAPAEADGVRLMSYGFVGKGASSGAVPAAVMRGPMVGKTVGQMLSGTDWGELDYLLVDLPPGTGDVHLTLSQTYGLSAAVLVTTPQRLSTVDVLKGVDMLRELGVPMISLVENMAHFTDDTGQTHLPFGGSQLEAVRRHAGLRASDTFRLPIEPQVGEAVDAGSPLQLLTSQSESAHALRAAARHLVVAIGERQHGAAAGGSGSHLRYDPKRGLVLRVLSGDHEGREFVLSKAALHALRGGAGAGDASAPLLDTVEPCETEAGQPGAKLYWCGGGATVVPLGDFPHLAAAHG